MANIEWKQVQNIPGNPVDGFRAFMEGMRGAEAAARGIRESQIKNHQVGMQALDQIMKGTATTRGQDIQESQIDANLQAAAMRAAASKGGKAEPFNRQELGTAAREHFFSGGTIDDFQFDGFDPFDKDQYAFASGVFKDSEARVTKAMATAEKRLEAARLDEINMAKSLAQEGTPEYEQFVREIDQKYAVQRQNLDAMVYEQELRVFRNRGSALGLNTGTPNTSQASSSASNFAPNIIESRATGSVSSQTAQTSAGKPHHAWSRIAERDDMIKEHASIFDADITALEEALDAGQISEEEFVLSSSQLVRQYKSTVDGLYNEWSQTVMTGSDGHIYGTDYQYNEDGNIQVGGKTLSPEVSSAIQEAAEISGIPVDMQLAIYGAESNYNPSAISKKGAGGLGQLTGSAIKDVIQNYPEELEAAGIPLSADMDRLDPRTNAIVSALYMKLQNDKYLGGRNNIEDRYIAYNIGSNNPFIKDKKFIDADPNTPINQIGFPTTSDAVKNNIGVYRKPNGQWRTKNEVYEEIRRRMGIIKATPDPNETLTTIEQKAAVDNAKTPSELPLSVQTESPADVNSRRYVELANIDFRSKPEAFADAAITIADSIIPNPGVVEGESVSNLDVTFYEEALTKAGVPTDSKTVARVREAFIKDPELNRLSSADVAAVITFAEKGMWGTGLDMAGLRTNIKKILENRENNRVEYRQFVDDSKALKTVAGEIKNKVKSFNKSANKAQQRLRGYNYDLSKTSDPEKIAAIDRLKNILYEDMDRNTTLHEQDLKKMHKEALERAAKIETMNQHLKKVFNKGVSNRALQDIENAKSSSKNKIYRDETGRMMTNPKYSTNKGAYFGPHWGY